MKKKYVSNLPPSRKLNLTRRHFVKATSALVGAGLLSSYGLPIYAASNVDEMTSPRTVRAMSVTSSGRSSINRTIK